MLNLPKPDLLFHRSPWYDRRMKILLVEWWDAVTDDKIGWKSIRHVRKQRPVLVRSVGWALKDKKSYVTLVASLDKHDCDGDVTIPRKMIRKVTVLRK